MGRYKLLLLIFNQIIQLNMQNALRATLLVTTLCVFLTSHAQNTARGTDKKENITASKTAKHINIPGTRVFILKPEGFVVASNFIGIKKGESAIIQVYDLVGGNYYSNAANFNQKNFEAKGAKVFEYREFTLNGYPVKFISMQGDAQSRSFSMVFGDSTFSAMIMAKYLVTDLQLESQIREALFSIVYDKKMTVMALASAKFSLNDKVSKFKFAKASSGMFVYSINGVDKKDYAKEPFVSVMTMPLEGNNAQTLAEELILGLLKYGLTEKQIANRSLQPVNGYNAIEFDMRGKIKNEYVNFHFLIVTDAEKAVVIQARYGDASRALLKDIKKLAHTVRIRS